MSMIKGPFLGSGLGYRHQLHEQIVANREKIDFLEIITDQFMYSPRAKYDHFREETRFFTLIPHNVGFSVGTDAPIDPDYIRRTAQIIEDFNSPWASDHLSQTKTPELDIGQLTPLWFTSELINTVTRNVKSIEKALGVPFLLENITYYFPLSGPEMTEAQFLTRVLESCDCGLLLDLNNVYINSRNHGYDPIEFLESIPLQRVRQIHYAGFAIEDEMIIDSHSSRTADDVWALLSWVSSRIDVPAVSLEWDEHFPAFEVLLEEVDTARSIVNEARLSIASN